MKNSDLISIIVPVYNVEKYLERCVYSILNQTYKNLEIILVDDGSTDNSGILCDVLSKKDDRILVYHKSNGGLSDARNYGIKMATGSYIGFVDSDDYIDENMYEHLYKIIKDTSSDIAECNVARIYGNCEKLHYTGKSYIKTLSVEQYIKEYLTMRKVYGSVWCKLIKSEIAKNTYFAIGKYYEDVFYNYELFKKIKKIVIIDKPYYKYFIRENSITTEKYTSKQYHLVDILTKLDLYVINKYPKYKEHSFIRLSYAYLSIFNHIILEDDYYDYDDFKKSYKFLRKQGIKIIKSKNADKLLKLSVCLILFNKKIYRFFYKKYKSRMVLNK